MTNKQWALAERVSNLVISAAFLKPIPAEFRESVRQLIEASLWLAFGHQQTEARRKWETGRARLPILKKIKHLNIDKVKVEIDGKTYDVTCASMVAEVTYELIRLQNSEFSDQFRKRSILRSFDMLAEYIITNGIHNKRDTARLIEYTLAEAEIATPDGGPYTEKKIQEKIPILKR